MNPVQQTRRLVWVCRRCFGLRKAQSAKDQTHYRCDGGCDLCGRSEFDLHPIYLKEKKA